MTINEFMAQYRRVDKNGVNAVRPRVLCADGYSVSVQGSLYHYSKPRGDSARYSCVELGFPNEADAEFLPFADDENNPTDTIYAMVPVSIVDYVLEKHGGIVGADFTNVGGIWND